MNASVSLFSKCSKICLKVEVSPSSVAQFIDKYITLTGENPQISQHYRVFENKWGIEGRIFFNGPEFVPQNLRIFSYNSEIINDNYSYKINNNELFWKMIRDGYKLGENIPIKSLF